ncbi:MAG: type II secretion system protein [Phycisphaerae bacterium]|jgi:prepilin-type N-terminal cleavage/methylation domain-containing protein/prepilin-type processing-associated H-X9-DG protein
MLRKSNSTCAFTLVELLVVISVIALLLGILFPVLRKAKSKADQVFCMHNLKQINLGMTFYLEANNDTYPCAQDPVSTNPFYWLWMGRGWRHFIEPYLVNNIDANNPSVLFCPADKKSKEIYDSTSYSYSMAFYHSPEQIDAMNSVTDTYSNPQPSMPQRTINVARPRSKIIIGEWLSVHEPTDDEDLGWWCQQGRRNFLFADGSTNFVKAEDILEARDGYPNPNLTVHGIRGMDISD